jgi:hypothetical protein
MPSVLRGRAWMFAIPAVVCLLVYAALEATGYSGLWPALTLIWVALVFGFYIFRRGRRCPQCGSPLIERHVYLHPSDTKYGLKRECRWCEVVWDLGGREHAD